MASIDERVSRLIGKLASTGEFAGPTESLRRIGKPAVPRLIEALAIPNACNGAALVLGWIGDLDAIEPLIKLLGTNDETLAGYAMNALAEIGPACLQPLCSLLQNASPQVRYRGAWALGLLREEGATLPLCETLADVDDNVRWRVLWAIGRIADHRAETYVSSLLADRAPEVRAAACRALARIGGESSVSALCAALQDQHEPNRELAARALEIIGSDESIKCLTSALESSPLKLRLAILRSLISVNRTDTMSAFESAILDEELRVRALAFGGLASLGVSSIPFLQSVARSLNPDLRCRAVFALGQIGGDKSLQEAIRATHDDNEHVRYCAVRVLRESNASEAKQAIRKLQGDLSVKVQYALTSGITRVN